MKRLTLVGMVLLTACGYFTHKAPEQMAKANDSVSVLRRKQAGWLAQLKTTVATVTDCDFALWAGESRAAGADVNLDGFETAGAVIRNPNALGCDPASRDMVLGYAYGRWKSADLAALERLADYGEAHAWQMSGNAETSTIDPVGQGILGRALDGLSAGADRRKYESNALGCLPLAKDFEQHLQVVEALLAGEVADKLEGHALQGNSIYHLLDLTPECVDVLKTLRDNSPKDALFAAAAGVYTGDMDGAIRLLTDDAYACPSYVRGDESYCTVHKAFAAYTVLRRYPAVVQ